jgi:hypothetical protein
MFAECLSAGMKWRRMFLQRRKLELVRPDKVGTRSRHAAGVTDRLVRGAFHKLWSECGGEAVW